jgi:hypothetical protein
VDELRIPLVKWKTAGDFIDWRILLTILGLALALGAMALSNLKAFGIDWARDLGNQLSESLRGLGSDPPYSL